LKKMLRKQNQLSKRLIMLTVILISFFQSTTGLTQEEGIPDNLILPKPEVLKVDNINKVSFDLEGYAIILQMYSAYQLYIENKSLYQDTKAYYENELKISNERLLLKDETIKILSEDREFIYQRMNKTLDEVAKEERRNKIRIILFSTGGVLVGTGIGILIGAFLIK
jgi:hypothetical protein